MLLPTKPQTLYKSPPTPLHKPTKLPAKFPSQQNKALPINLQTPCKFPARITCNTHPASLLPSPPTFSTSSHSPSNSHFPSHNPPTSFPRCSNTHSSSSPNTTPSHTCPSACPLHSERPCPTFQYTSAIHSCSYTTCLLRSAHHCSIDHRRAWTFRPYDTPFLLPPDEILHPNYPRILLHSCVFPAYRTRS